ncbi:MAG: CDP-alcohol phosphatidyltransferase family protein [Candidatus Uhrbacteria bacterium]|nr:CDP-alcohol phosphatidyltransferase family protein [Candidatus Uhrbacteria bacterium]
MGYPSFRDTHYFPSDKVLITDRLIDRTILWALPPWITPNHITLFRMFAIPPTLFLIIRGYYDIAVPVFLFVSSTDAIDGALARTRNKITEWGMIFDPVADKLLIVPVLLILLLRNLPIPLALTIISLELAIVATAVLWRRRGGVIQANLWGKIKMVLQVLGVFLLLLAAWLNIPLVVPAAIILGASIYFSILSMVYHGV